MPPSILQPRSAATIEWEFRLPTPARGFHGVQLGFLILVLYVSYRLLYKACNIFRAPRAVAHLRGPPSVHWLMGSYTKRDIGGGRFTHRVLGDIRQYGKVHGSILMGRQPHIVVADPQAITKVLLQSLYPKVPTSLRHMRRHVGRGLLGEEGDAHRRQRKIAAPAFAQATVNAMHSTIKEKALSLVGRLNRAMNHAQLGQPESEGMLLNCSDHFNKMALDVIGSVGFGYEFNALYEDCQTPLDDAFKALMASMSTGTAYALLRSRIGTPVERLGRWLQVREQLELDQAMQTVQNVSQLLVARAKVQAVQAAASADAAMKEVGEKKTAVLTGPLPDSETEDELSEVDTVSSRRPQEKGTPADLLSLMVRANMAPGLKPSQRLSDAELRGMVPAMLSAGHETASTALSWACHALTQPGHGQEVQRRLRAELLSSHNSWQEDAASHHALPYLDAVVRETLRLHSPIRGLRRLVPHDDVLPLSFPIELADGSKTKDLVVKGGTVLFFSLIAINTDDELWGDGLVFRPERWLEETHEHHDPTHPFAAQSPARSEPLLKNVWSSMMTFGMGPTNCIGMRVALMEIKMALAAVLSNFEVLPAHREGEGEAPVEIDYLIQIVAHPVVKGREKEGTQVPIRLRRLPDTSPSSVTRI
ncbi:hypothetical protein V8E36_004086 [Tilletia maclaganii]